MRLFYLRFVTRHGAREVLRMMWNDVYVDQKNFAVIVMTIDERLKSYRRKKHKEQMTESIKNAVRNIFSSNRNDNTVESTKEEEVRLQFVIFYSLLGMCGFFS